MLKVLFLACFLGVLAGAGSTHASDGPDAGERNNVFVMDMKGPIGIASRLQLTRAIERVRREFPVALVIRLDTPGGLVSATRDIVQEIVAAPIPILVYVGPSGARAASAGTFIVYAAHAAAMAPGTHLGAATPVSMGGLPGPARDKDGDKGARSASEQKAINDIAAMLRSLAQLRGRNAEFAEKAVREAETMTAEEAVKAGVVEFLLDDVREFLVGVDSRSFQLPDDEVRAIYVRDANIVTVEPDWSTRILSIISDPNIAFILLMIGFYGIVLEFWNPGTLVAGTVGAISLILALVALTALPVHYGALALLLLGVGLMLWEAFTPGFGILGASGLIAFVAGAIFLFDGSGWDVDVALAWPVIAGAALSTAIVIFGVAGAAARAHRQRALTGMEELIGSRAEVIDWSGETGTVRLHGEIWSARAKGPLAPRAAVRIVSLDGLIVTVEAA